MVNGANKSKKENDDDDFVNSAMMAHSSTSSCHPLFPVAFLVSRDLILLYIIEIF